ncbi:MAG: ATP-binding cassette domain-containing protein [Ruminococcus sp.]
MGTILEAKHLTYGYEEGTHAIEDLSLTIEEGKTTALLGANGAGKSTLFLHFNGILQPEHGEVLFHGEPISYKKEGLRKLRSKVGIVFQNPDDQLFSASVYQDISFGAVNMGLPKEEVHRRVEAVMEQIGITHLRDRSTHSLSFGQKKRVSFAGIMVMQPEVIILDEPTAGLDPVGVSELMHLLKRVCKEQHTTILLSTHDIDVIPVYADTIYLIDKGKILTHGTPKEIFLQPELLRSHHLRLPRLSHLLEVLQKEDGLDVDFSEATISGARKQILQCLDALKREDAI